MVADAIRWRDYLIPVYDAISANLKGDIKIIEYYENLAVCTRISKPDVLIAVRRTEAGRERSIYGQEEKKQ